MFRPFFYKAIIRSRPDEGIIIEGPKHVVYYYSFTTNKVCCVFDCQYFNLILLSDTIMPIIRSLRLYIYLQLVVHNLCYGWPWVWCVAVGYASGLRDVARLPQP
jgi:hypothetical protein